MRWIVLPLLPVAMMAAGQANAEAGRIKTMVGDDSVERKAQRQPAVSGMVILERDVIVTGKAGRAVIIFGDNSRFSISPNSRIEVSKFAFDRKTRTGDFATQVDRGSLSIVAGQIAKSNPNAMKVRVATPQSLLGVRGTRFVVEVK